MSKLQRDEGNSPNLSLSSGLLALKRDGTFSSTFMSILTREGPRAGTSAQTSKTKTERM